MRNEFSHWLRGSGLEIVMILSVSLLLLRFFDNGARYFERRSSESSEDDISSRTRGALIQAGRYGLSFATVTVAALMILSRFSVPLGSLVPVAAVAGTGLGFGAQRVVADFLAGFFLVTERQFGVGDMIKISAVGSETGIVGVVEEVTLRVTRIRRLNGDIVIFPNSELRQVSNMSRDWARLLVEVPVPEEENVDHVGRRIDQIGEELYGDEKWKPLILERPQVSGVEQLEAGAVRLRVIGRTLPGKQWDVERELRRRIVLATHVDIDDGSLSDPRARDVVDGDVVDGDAVGSDAAGIDATKVDQAAADLRDGSER